MPPTPLARASADRFMFDVGNTKYLASLLPREALDRVGPEARWTVRQTLAHLADSLHGYAEILAATHAHEVLDPERFDPTAHNAEVATANRETALPAIVEVFDAGLRTLLPEVLKVDEASADLKIGYFSVEQVLQAWSGHITSHVMEMLDLLPEVRSDLMLVNWLLYVDFERQPANAERQRRLLEEVREHHAKAKGGKA